MTQLLEARISLLINAVSLLPFHLVFLPRNINILLFQEQILMTDFSIIRFQTVPKSTVI